MDNIVAASEGVDRPQNFKNLGRDGDFLSTCTNNQWYCFMARQSVFFSAFSSESPDISSLIKMAKSLIRLAPQLGMGYDGAILGKIPDDEILAKIINIKEVDELDEYPHKWDMAASEVFSQTNLPFFRIKAVVRRGGKDDLGRASMILIISTHALIEGADASLLSRSRESKKDDIIVKQKPISKFKSLAYGTAAAILAPLQLLAAKLFVSRKIDANYKALSVEREKIKRVAEKLNISQRALIFALSAYCLNDKGKGFSRKTISAIYADLDGASRFQTNDDFFRFRMVALKLKYDDDFIKFAKNVDEAIIRLESSDIRKTQAFFNAMFGAHRWLKNNFPFLYSDKVFRFSAGYHLSLSLLPPQRLFGRITKGMMEPIYAGTYHPGMNMSVFAPGRTQISFNFSLKKRLLNNVDRIEGLLDEIDKQLA